MAEETVRPALTVVGTGVEERLQGSLLPRHQQIALLRIAIVAAAEMPEVVLAEEDGEEATLELMQPMLGEATTRPRPLLLDQPPQASTS